MEQALDLRYQCLRGGGGGGGKDNINEHITLLGDILRRGFLISLRPAVIPLFLVSRGRRRASDHASDHNDDNMLFRRFFFSTVVLASYSNARYGVCMVTHYNRVPGTPKLSREVFSGLEEGHRKL